jgi:hypothetical protein
VALRQHYVEGKMTADNQMFKGIATVAFINAKGTQKI